MRDNQTPSEDAADRKSALAQRLAAVLGYHEESKHRVGRMAPSLGYMDWANQPEPFRHYQGCKKIPPPFLAQDPDLSYEGLFAPPQAAPAPVSKATIGAVLELSLALSAWKSSGASRWALRMVPSSGNLHPTEAYDPEMPLFLLKPGDYVFDAIHISCDQTIAGYSAFSLGMLARFHPYLKTAPGAYRHLFWEAGLVGHLLYLEAEAQGYRGTGIGCFFDDGMHNLLGLKDREFQSLYHFTIGAPVADARLRTLPAYHHLES